MTRLVWHHTEFGRRTACQTYRIVRHAAGWQLLDAHWDPLAAPVATVALAQQIAEGVALRAARARARGTSPTSQTPGTSQT